MKPSFLFPKQYMRNGAIALLLAIVAAIFFISKVTLWGFWPGLLLALLFIIPLCYYAALVMSPDERKHAWLPDAGSKWFTIAPVVLAIICAMVEYGSK